MSVLVAGPGRQPTRRVTRALGDQVGLGSRPLDGGRTRPDEIPPPLTSPPPLPDPGPREPPESPMPSPYPVPQLGIARTAKPTSVLAR